MILNIIYSNLLNLYIYNLLFYYIVIMMIIIFNIIECIEYCGQEQMNYEKKIDIDQIKLRKVIICLYIQRYEYNIFEVIDVKIVIFIIYLSIIYLYNNKYNNNDEYTYNNNDKYTYNT